MCLSSERRSVSGAPFICDGGKPNSVRSPTRTGRSFISSRLLQTPITHSAIPDRRYSYRVRPYPEIGPEFLQSIGGPAALLLFCLAPHGVFPAARITSRAVSLYLAFSPLPAFSQRTGGMFSVTLSVNPDFRRGCPRILRGMLPYGVRTFLQ